MASTNDVKPLSLILGIASSWIKSYDLWLFFRSKRNLYSRFNSLANFLNHFQLEIDFLAHLEQG